MKTQPNLVLKLSLISALTATTSIAHAGALERSAFSSALLFEEGRVATFGMTYADPSVSGTITHPILGALSTDDMADPYTTLHLGYKYDITDNVALALQIDTPYGASVNYSNANPVTDGINADLSSYRMSMLLGYTFNDRVTVFGGPLLEQINAASVSIPVASYALESDSSLGYGFALGAAYEIPEYALRVALTYTSAISHDLNVTENSVLKTTQPIETPQSVKLDFQTGLNDKTLLTAGVRWTEWSNFEIAPTGYLGATGTPLISYEDDVMAYNLGIGRKITDNWSILGGIAYEAATGNEVTLLGPTDGLTSISLGAQYTRGNSKIRFGGSYGWLGDASGSSPAPFTFDSNTVWGLGLSFTQSF